ncbi:hypothetical protein [Flavobacterium sp. FPG59]|uniref:hypothetical protein n=1 Tax=Flavobacterium sp. FPG59 TaxID=1929267 RepID=UPI000A3635DD|nr:hypothetical protein [Flavobacterium sp. FPG59]OUD35251.1 hypothetical protein FPG59_10940 [Flavobacterium sp. FPG59]
MKKKVFLKLIILFTNIVSTTTYAKEKKINYQFFTTNIKNDTIIVKKKNNINKSYEIGFYSKSYSYYWLVGKDTLDFIVNATEHEKDSTLHISIHHKRPITFTTALSKLNYCLSLNKEDFYLSKLNSLYFKEPFFYLDMSKDLSTEYKKQFGQKNINNEKLNQFFLKSKLKVQLDKFLNQFNKITKYFSIEKFHLTSKKHYHEYLHNINLADYPDDIINGMGLYVKLDGQKK